ncbi:sucrase/ferredoxin-like domain-containing protein [Aspergillus ibericus CBS 121593]|uniref:Altered inheritance of mitochondria protein 32 n=1 Tax=Aspergillus ibericus CBS 121593 TaxID=1448316 RepID=A0A395GWG1_9EURO|nr:sucrase/ferredoxin-like family protein Fmi1 [Aspergillus ibericus CBS 121593]RAK99358.1 sucrase/ferredoxin-like family protein Fmi1 [Aspergillus ibericus CBS 121593]
MRAASVHCLSPISRASSTGASSTTRFFSSTSLRSHPARIPLDIPPPFPVTKTCPEPSCSCPATPSMPAPIDYDQPLNGTMAAYAQQLLVCTGQRDWTSRIEEDGQGQNWGELVRGLKRLLGRGGKYADPFNNILVTTSSFPSSPSTSTATSQTASAFLFPSFKYFPSIPVTLSEPNDVKTDVSTFVRAYLLPSKSQHGGKTREAGLASEFPDAIDLQHSPVVLICGHGGRDMRCGVMAPVLEKEFQRVLQTKGFTSVDSDHNVVDSPEHAYIGLISHVGGHKYAGNVIVYIPPDMKEAGSSAVHPLAGKGIWYGRIEPKHVQGVVEETILGGRVIADHFRGGIDRDGGILRL